MESLNLPEKKNGVIEVQEPDGSISVSHWVDDKLHREDGPARTTTWKDGTKTGHQVRYFMQEGVPHREDGPWYEDTNEPNLNLDPRYYLKGVPVKPGTFMYQMMQARERTRLKNELN